MNKNLTGLPVYTSLGVLRPLKEAWMRIPEPLPSPFTLSWSSGSVPEDWRPWVHVYLRKLPHQEPLRVVSSFPPAQVAQSLS